METNKTIIALRRYVQSSLGCLYLIAGGFFLPKHRRLLSTLSAHFGFEAKGAPAAAQPQALVPKITPEELLGQSLAVTMTELSHVNGGVSALELVIISALTRRTDPQRSFEIGTFDGRTTLNMALNQRAGSEVITLDLPAAQLERAAQPLDDGDRTYILKAASGARFQQRTTPARIVQVYGDSATFDFSRYAGAVDLMFVDGSHSYDYARSDSRVALSLVRPGGLILWHDYDTPYWPGVTRALNELCAQKRECAGLMHIAGTSLCLLQR